MEPNNKPELGYAGKAVGLDFNPAGDTPVGHNVMRLKQMSAEFIAFCDNVRAGAEDPEVKRMCSIAITEAQTAQMWAVKAVTWGAK